MKNRRRDEKEIEEKGSIRMKKKGGARGKGR